MMRIEAVGLALVAILASGGTLAWTAEEKPRETWMAAARGAMKEEKWEEAVQSYQRAFALGPGTPQEYGAVSKILCMLKRGDEAAAMVREGIRQHPDDWQLKIELAVSLNVAEHYGEAFEKFKELEGKLREARPDLLNDEFYFHAGATAERAGRIEEAIRLFEQSIAKVPGDADPLQAARPYNYLGYLLLEQNRDLGRALELIHQANELAPGQSAYADSSGWAEFKLGRYPEALKELLRAERLMKEDGHDDPEILDHLAQTYFRLGHRDRAIEYMRRAIDLEPKEKGYRTRLEEFQKTKTVDPVPLDFLKDPNGSADKRRGRRR